MMEGNGVMVNFMAFYASAFGEEGFVTLDTIINNANNTVPLGMEEMVDWISVNTDIETQQRCTAC
jgi:hypothetical protein